MGDKRRGVRRQLVLAHRGDEHEIELRRIDAGDEKRVTRCARREIAQALVSRRAAARLDPRTADDPVFVDADPLRDRSVRNDLVGQVTAESEDGRQAHAAGDSAARDRAVDGRDRRREVTHD
jgi:hypothetical protein